ncbi:MAG: hypothetical protein HGA65_00130 [Oscillochloris sp.]|nr:hypothetical protein [Oscillochloris sp.]
MHQLTLEDLGIELCSPQRMNTTEQDLQALDRPADDPPRTVDLPPELVALRAAYLEAAAARIEAEHRYYAALSRYYDAGAIPPLGKYLVATRRYLEGEIARRKAAGMPYTQHARLLADLVEPQRHQTAA